MPGAAAAISIVLLLIFPNGGPTRCCRRLHLGRSLRPPEPAAVVKCAQLRAGLEAAL